jgi:hypothetical protein
VPYSGTLCFIKTVEDLYEAMAGSVPGVKFGIAFAEASGPLPPKERRKRGWPEGAGPPALASGCTP